MKKPLTYLGAGLLAISGQQGMYSQAADPLPVKPNPVPSVIGGASNNLNERANNQTNNRNHGANNNQTSGFYPDDESPWFDNDNLRRELELDNDQIKRLNDAYGATWKQLRGNQVDSGRNNASDIRRNSQANTNSSRANSNQNLDNGQRATRLNEYRSRFDDQFNRSTSDIFRNRQQQERFNQLRMQYQGYGAFNNPALQRQMNLNDTQMRQLQELNQEWDTQMDEFRNSYARDREGTTNRFNDFNQSARTRFDGILNDQQRQQYNEMTGDQFDFGADARFGNRNTNAQANTSGAIDGSGIGTPQDNGPQGSGIGTPQDNGPQGSGIGTPTDTGVQGSGLGTGQDTGTQGSGLGTGTGAGAGGGTGAGTSTGGGAGTGSGSGSGGSGS